MGGLGSGLIWYCTSVATMRLHTFDDIACERVSGIELNRMEQTLLVTCTCWPVKFLLYPPSLLRTRTSLC